MQNTNQEYDLKVPMIEGQCYPLNHWDAKPSDEGKMEVVEATSSNSTGSPQRKRTVTSSQTEMHVISSGNKPDVKRMAGSDVQDLMRPFRVYKDD